MEPSDPLTERLRDVERHVAEMSERFNECRQASTKASASIGATLRVWAIVGGVMLTLWAGVTVYAVRLHETHAAKAYHEGALVLVGGTKDELQKEILALREKTAEIATIRTQLASLSTQVERMDDKIDKLLER